ncbi:hypothetical protein M501DRAFT_1000323 [Patellaria atrata CBS 101060]|uniref:Uncharacterized protein n=1 Tax=Patellaria atrata CBS 101060 TaxID=1346257 RepID=A0A9P4SG52_9PEZI|nr:hypothetical protein M501DRAFT_1000323 [Patellaria atrata CBS 101060]
MDPRKTEDTYPTSTPQDSERNNPFITFRHFIDDQANALYKSFAPHDRSSLNRKHNERDPSDRFTENNRSNPGTGEEAYWPLRGSDLKEASEEQQGHQDGWRWRQSRKDHPWGSEWHWQGSYNDSQEPGDNNEVNEAVGRAELQREQLWRQAEGLWGELSRSADKMLKDFETWNLPQAPRPAREAVVDIDEKSKPSKSLWSDLVDHVDLRPADTRIPTDDARRVPLSEFLPWHLCSQFDSFLDEAFPFGESRAHHPAPSMFRYLQLNSYSPLKLEKEFRLGNGDDNWRRAFEDLQRAESGLTLVGPSNSTNPVRKCPSDWISGLILGKSFTALDPQEFSEDQAGKIPESGWTAIRQLQNTITGEDEEQLDELVKRDMNWLGLKLDEETDRWYDSENDPNSDKKSPRDNKEPHLMEDCACYIRGYAWGWLNAREQSGALESEEPSTELDLYERISPPIEESRNSTKDSPSARALDPETVRSSKILSTLTTTERSTLPDGTVTTKVVLKKRFDDGREETSSSVHTSNVSEDRDGTDSFNDFQNPATESAETQATTNGSDKKKNRGWFWSN